MSIWSLLNITPTRIDNQRNTNFSLDKFSLPERSGDDCKPAQFNSEGFSLPEGKICYPPCLHDISLVKGGSTGYAY